MTQELQDSVKIFGTALQQLFQVALNCFGTELNQGYLESIQKFEETYRRLPHAKDPEKQLSCTIKAHCIFQHVPETIEKTGKALGVFSAQSFESAHYEFVETWKRFKVPSDHPNYAKQLLNAVVNFNSFHVCES